MRMSPILLLILTINIVALVYLVAVLQPKLSRLAHLENWLRGIPNRDEWANESKRNREEQQNSLKAFNDSVLKQMADISTLSQNNQEKLRESIEKRLLALQDDNNKKLEKMRETVDEKLQSTLEKRLGQSFKLVSDRLEQVHKGLGEMQTLATGVGDLKKVLTNVKTRGTWGEVQLDNLLSQMLSPEQYDKNVRIKPKTQEFVEFAVKLPGKTGDASTPIWLPIDAKYPQDTYQHIIQAQEQGDKPALDLAIKQLETSMKLEAKRICEKYIDPPNTTDFAILFLPIEGLYAEVLRCPNLHTTLQQKYRVLIAGPTTLAALLNSLQMGFKTLAIEKRSSEVWAVLSGIKQEFGKFGDLLEKTQKKLQQASDSIETAASKSRTISRKLNKVEELPETHVTEEAPQLYAIQD
jgi:DNA recombination protein RmuC